MFCLFIRIYEESRRYLSSFTSKWILFSCFRSEDCIPMMCSPLSISRSYSININLIERLKMHIGTFNGWISKKNYSFFISPSFFVYGRIYSINTNSFFIILFRFVKWLTEMNTNSKFYFHFSYFYTDIGAEINKKKTISRYNIIQNEHSYCVLQKW